MTSPIALPPVLRIIPKLVANLSKALSIIACTLEGLAKNKACANPCL